MQLSSSAPMLPEPVPPTSAGDPPGEVATGSTTTSIVVKLDRRTHELAYHPGDTLLEAARRGGLRPPSSCEAGDCATCMAHLDVGTVTMRANNALEPDEVADGWVLTCQSLPTSREVVVSYDV
jgi:ferredoxin